jgi:nucleoside phosphorylase
MTTLTGTGGRPDRLALQTRRCDVLLLVMLPDEWQSFLRIFPEANAQTQEDHLLDGLTVSVREFKFAGYEVVAAALNPNAIESKNQGKVPAAVFTSCVLTKYIPQVIVNIGIACRINKSDCSLGDVVIATSLVDITGNTSIEPGPEPDKLHFRSGNPDIECNEELRRSLTRLPSTHGQLFARWHQTCSGELLKIEATPSEHLVREGPVATGEFLSKSELFHEVVKNSLRTTLAYEMEAYAIAETVRLLHNKAPILILKGLSDDGDGLKAKLESTTKGRLRAVAAENAFRLLHLALTAGVVAATGHRDLPTLSHRMPAGMSPQPGEQSRAFPYFAPSDFSSPRVLAKGLVSGAGRYRAMKTIICESDPALLAQLESTPRPRTSRSV